MGEKTEKLQVNGRRYIFCEKWNITIPTPAAKGHPIMNGSFTPSNTTWTSKKEVWYIFGEIIIDK